MKIVECVQRSPEWRAARLGKLTGSRVADAFATIKTKGAEAAGRRNYRVQLVLERITGQCHDDTRVTRDMERGCELEEDARSAYEAETGIFVESVGFIAHDELLAGCSPDGLIFGEQGRVQGLIEIKCPKAATHLDYLREGLPRDYFLQIVHGLWLTGAEWGDFVSYSPSFPEPLRLKRTRVSLSSVELAAHEVNVRAFLSEVEKEFLEVQTLAMARSVA